jgi:hypothetical protein
LPAQETQTDRLNAREPKLIEFDAPGAVTINLQLGRWRCRNSDCARQIFTQRVSDVCRPILRLPFYCPLSALTTKEKWSALARRQAGTFTPFSRFLAMVRKAPHPMRAPSVFP